MAKSYGTAGKSSRDIADQRRMTHHKMYFFAILALLGVLWVLPALSAALKGTVSTVVMVGILVGMKWLEFYTDVKDRQLRKGIRQAKRGAQGEDTVAALLETLPDDYYVYHDINKVAGDIDHIVVGPTGIFVIETKSHGGEVTAQNGMLLVNGHAPEKDFVAQSWRNAYWVQDVLKNTADITVKVQPILIFPNAFVKTRSVKGIWVLYRKILVNRIREAPPVAFDTARAVEILRMKLGGMPPAATGASRV
jgi:hypothetical protein